MSRVGHYLITVTGLLTVTWSLPLAAAPASGGPASVLEVGPAGDYLIKSMLILLVVLAVMAVLLKLLRRYGHLKKASGNRLRVIEAISLGGHERALLVAVDGREVLLGVSQGRVQPLLQMGAPGETASESIKGRKSVEQAAEFSELLNSEQR